MEGFESGVILLAALGALAGVLWVISKADGFLQGRRGVPIDSKGRRADGPIAKVALIAVVIAVGIFLAWGGISIDPEYTFRRP